MGLHSYSHLNSVRFIKVYPVVKTEKVAIYQWIVLLS